MKKVNIIITYIIGIICGGFSFFYLHRIELTNTFFNGFLAFISEFFIIAGIVSAIGIVMWPIPTNSQFYFNFVGLAADIVLFIFYVVHRIRIALPLEILLFCLLLLTAAIHYFSLGNLRLIERYEYVAWRALQAAESLNNQYNLCVDKYNNLKQMISAQRKELNIQTSLFNRLKNRFTHEALERCDSVKYRFPSLDLFDITGLSALFPCGRHKAKTYINDLIKFCSWLSKYEKKVALQYAQIQERIRYMETSYHEVKRMMDKTTDEIPAEIGEIMRETAAEAFVLLNKTSKIEKHLKRKIR